MAFQLHVEVRGDRIAISSEPAGVRLDLANVLVIEPLPPVGEGRLVAVGQRIADLPPSHLQSSGITEIVPFGRVTLSARYAVAFLRYEARLAHATLWPGWRNAFRVRVPVVALDYPAWPGLPIAERTAFMKEARRGFGGKELTVNGTPYLRLSIPRRLLGARPWIRAES